MQVCDAPLEAYGYIAARGKVMQANALRSMKKACATMLSGGAGSALGFHARGMTALRDDGCATVRRAT